ncbi:MAG: hypothetical protein ACI4NE_02695 [Succinivibrio sp.]
MQTALKNLKKATPSLTRDIFKPMIKDNYEAIFEQYALSELDDSETSLEAYASKHRLSVFEMFKSFSEIFDKPFTDLERFAFEELFELQHLSKEELISNNQEYLKSYRTGDLLKSYGTGDFSTRCSVLLLFLYLCFKNNMETILNDDEKLEEVVAVFFKIYNLLIAPYKVSRELCHLKFIHLASIVYRLYLIEELSDIKMPVFIEKSSDFIEFAKILTTPKISSNQTMIFNVK